MHPKQDRPGKGGCPYRIGCCKQRAMGHVCPCSRKACLETCGRHDTSEHLRPFQEPERLLSNRLCQEELVEATAFRYITDAITRDEAIALLKAKEAGKKDREAKVRELG